MTQNRPFIWAHRGASGYAPENTLEAFAKAVELHADGVELDIHLTKDNQLVVIHDETIDRTSNGHGWVKDMTLSELRQYNYNKTHPEYVHCDIPTLEEVFTLLKPTDLTIDIELKTGIVFYEGIEEKVLALVRQYGMEQRVNYSSFNHASVKKMHVLDPSCEIGFLYADGPLDMVEYAKKHNANALNPALYNLQYPGFVEQCHKEGILLNVWTVNEISHMQMCIACGVRSIITNYPDVVLNLLQENTL